jgi:hypothetical protein
VIENKAHALEYANLVYGQEAEKAYRYILDVLEPLPGYLGEAGPKGYLSQFMIKNTATGAISYSFTFFKDSLLFRIRASGIVELKKRDRTADVMERLTAEEKSGEVRFKIVTVEDAKQAMRILFG